MSLETGVISTALEAVRHQLLVLDQATGRNTSGNAAASSAGERHGRAQPTATDVGEGLVRLIDARRTLGAALVALEAADHATVDAVDQSVRSGPRVDASARPSTPKTQDVGARDNHGHLDRVMVQVRGRSSRGPASMLARSTESPSAR